MVIPFGTRVILTTKDTNDTKLGSFRNFALLNLNQGMIPIFGHNRFVFGLVSGLIHRPGLIDLTAVLPP